MHYKKTLPIAPSTCSGSGE